MSENSAASLYCAEDADNVVASYTDTWIYDLPSPSDESNIDRLFDSEPHHMPHPDYLRLCRDRSIDLTARQDSINWILKVHARYQFRPVTALLSVNYFDRFLSTHSLPQSNGWPFQLLSVACLSLAAKMEEVYVPLLLELQVFEPRFLFEPRTVQRMELCVMASLDWRLRSVTPFDYLHYFISKLPSSRSKPDHAHLLSTCSDLILNTTRAIDFLGFSPSTIAAAALLSAAGQNEDLPETSYERLNKEMVRSCRQLMEEYVIDTCTSADPKDRRAEPPSPPSPIGVLDAAACGSCDTRSENQNAPSGSGSGTGHSEPPSKRVRSSGPDVQEQQQP